MFLKKSRNSLFADKRTLYKIGDIINFNRFHGDSFLINSFLFLFICCYITILWMKYTLHQKGA